MVSQKAAVRSTEPQEAPLRAPDAEGNDELRANLHAWAALVDKDQALRIALCEYKLLILSIFRRNTNRHDSENRR